MKYEENNKVELKREFIDEIKLEIIAFLNSNGGTIYVGINDDGSINESFKKVNHDAINLKLSSWIQEAFFPMPSNLITYNFSDNGILTINILEGVKKPYYLKDKGPKPSGVYKRVGSSKRKANEEEILKMIMDSNHYDFESDKSDKQNLKFTYFDRVCLEKNIPVNKKQKINFGLINSKDEYTNIGLLLSDESPIEIKIAEYDDNLNFKIKKSLKGSLIKVLIDTQEIAERLNDVSAVIDSSSFVRRETVSYPGASLREMILNAFCHANYFIRSNIKIEFYADKVKITSPGGLYKTTLDEVLRGVQTYRNPKLVHVLDKMGFIENFGTGIPRTLDAYKESGKKPEFYDSENFFIVSLPNLNYEDEINENKSPNNRQINRQINSNISELGLRILRIIKDNPGINVPKLFDSLNKSIPELNADKIRYSIKSELKELIIHKKSNKSGGYYLK